MLALLAFNHPGPCAHLADMTAGVGGITVKAATQWEKVTAYEASPSRASALAKNVSRYSNVEVVAGDAVAGVRRDFLGPGPDVAAMVDPPWGGAGESYGRGPQTVASITLAGLTMPALLSGMPERVKTVGFKLPTCYDVEAMRASLVERNWRVAHVKKMRRTLFAVCVRGGGRGSQIQAKRMEENGKILADMRARRKRVHPLKQPYRVAPSQVPICRFHNYGSKGCAKGELCPYDHSHCHICVRPGHAALGCPYFVDESKFKEFRAAHTLLSTRPSSYQKKTVLGDPVWWDTDSLPLECRLDDGQLRRCRRHKRFEAGLLCEVEEGGAFVDAGAHFGDTAVTMAVRARAEGRKDIRFFAFEPSTLKCRWIEEAAKANGVSVTVVNAAVGDMDRIVKPERSGKKRALFDGSMKYEEVEGDNSSDNEGDDGNVRMVSLDSIVESISPLGILHLDVEGWEAQVLKGANEVLEKSGDRCWIIAEVWEDKDCLRRGVEGGMEKKIEAVMSQHVEFKRREDIKDQERNVVYAKG